MAKNTPSTTTIKDWTVKTRRNYVPGKGTKIKGNSETVQNDTLSVAQLLLKHINGATIREKEGVYIPNPDHDDLDGEKFHQSDLAEKEDVRTEIKALSARLKQEEQEYAKELQRRSDAKEQAGKQAGNAESQK